MTRFGPEDRGRFRGRVGALLAELEEGRRFVRRAAEEKNAPCSEVLGLANVEEEAQTLEDQEEDEDGSSPVEASASDAVSTPAGAGSLESKESGESVPATGPQELEDAGSELCPICEEEESDTTYRGRPLCNLCKVELKTGRRPPRDEGPPQAASEEAQMSSNSASSGSGSRDWYPRFPGGGDPELERPYLQHKTHALEELVDEFQASSRLMKVIREELSHRSTSRAEELRQRVEGVLDGK